MPFFISSEKEDKEVNEIIGKTFSFLETTGGVKIPRRYVGSSWSDGEYGSVKWYVDQAFNPIRRQVNFDNFWHLVEREPWQKDQHLELFVLDRDMYYGDNTFIFGYTHKLISTFGSKVKGIVVSLNRIRQYNNWQSSFFNILLHEQGHFYGVPMPNPNYISHSTIDLDRGHCNDRNCVMEQVNIPGRLDLSKKAEFLLRHNPHFFCGYDIKSLRETLRKIYSNQ